jgi:hypothetical protein
MAERQYLRNTKPLTAEMCAVLMVLRDSPTAITQAQIQSAIGPKGARVSIAEACEYLEDPKVEFIKRTMKPPKTACLTLTDEGERGLKAHLPRAIRDLEARIQNMRQPHPRDKSVLDPDLVKPYEHLLASLKAGKFRKPLRTVEFEDEDPGPVQIEEEAPSRAYETARRQQQDDAAVSRRRARQDAEAFAGEVEQGIEEENPGEPTDADLRELEDNQPARKPAKLGTRRNRVPRGVKPRGRGKPRKSSVTARDMLPA